MKKGWQISGAALVLAAVLALPAAAADRITVAASRSLASSGFLDTMAPLALAQAGIAVRWEVTDNDQVIQLARDCGVDAILVSAPAAEVKLVQDGVGALRLRVMTGSSKEQYDVIVVNPGACPSTDISAGMDFARWITSAGAQAAIARFTPANKEARYTPNAGTETCPTCEAQP